jgi:hypothetical protein
MTEILHFLDAHASAVQGFVAIVQGFMAIVLVGVTAYYAGLTKSIARSAVDAQRPYVFFDLVGNGYGMMEFIVGNDGSRAAQDVRFALKTEGSDRLDGRLRDLAVFDSGLPYLAPGRRYRFNLETSVADASIFERQDGQAVTLAINMAYRGGKQKITDEMFFDFSALNGVGTASFADPLTAISEQLKVISQSMIRKSSRPGDSRVR